MQPDLMSPPPSGEGAERLACSARGWHSIQLAVLGFIGICGVLRTGSDSNGPQWIRWLAATLALFAFALACLAIYQVGRVAYPFYGAPTPSSPGPDGLAASTRQLRTGRTLRFGAAQGTVSVRLVSVLTIEPVSSC